MKVEGVVVVYGGILWKDIIESRKMRRKVGRDINKVKEIKLSKRE